MVLGLDKPYYQQYGIFLKDAFKGDLGESIKEGEPVTPVILDRLPNTLMLGFSAFAFSVLLGVPLGVLSAVKRGSLIDIFGWFSKPY